MIYPDVTLEEWMTKFPGLEPQEIECPCGGIGKTTKPVITKDWVGLVMPKCKGCGEEEPGVIFKSRNPLIQAEMNSFLKK